MIQFAAVARTAVGEYQREIKSLRSELDTLRLRSAVAPSTLVEGGKCMWLLRAVSLRLLLFVLLYLMGWC
jgi:hypothetical protein